MEWAYPVRIAILVNDRLIFLHLLSAIILSQKKRKRKEANWRA
nr:MAG TPA: hypothetical protein [Caudoviricetes sp.]